MLKKSLPDLTEYELTAGLSVAASQPPPSLPGSQKITNRSKGSAEVDTSAFFRAVRLKAGLSQEEALNAKTEKRIYEETFPETRHGGDRRSENQVCKLHTCSDAKPAAWGQDWGIW